MKRERGTEKVIEHEGDGNTDYNWCTWNNPQSFSKGTGRPENNRTREDHPNYIKAKIDENMEKSHGDLKRLAVAQTSVRNHQVRVV